LDAVSLSRNPLAAVVPIVIGVALLGVEAIRVYDGSTLGSLNQAVLWVGLALVVLGALFLVVGVAAAEAATSPAATGEADGTAEPAAADSDVTASSEG
jgi:hypothetical protein